MNPADWKIDQFLAYQAPGSFCWNARIKMGTFFCRCKKKKKEEDVEKAGQKDKPATSAIAVRNETDPRIRYLGNDAYGTHHLLVTDYCRMYATAS